MEQDVEHFGIGLLDFVEEDHRIGPPTHRLRQLSGLFVADISRRCTDHAGHRVLLLVLGHVDPHHRLVVVEQEFGKRACEFGFADARWPEEHETAERTVRILQSGSGAADRVRHRHDGVVLADDAFVETLFHVNQLLDLAFHQPGDRDVRPLADDFGDVFFVHFLLQHSLARLRRQARLFVPNLLFELRHTSVLQLGRLGEVAGSLRGIELASHRFELFFQLAGVLNGVLLVLPLRRQSTALFLQVGKFLVEFREPFD